MHENSLDSKTKTAAPGASFKARFPVQLYEVFPRWHSIGLNRTKSDSFFTPMNSDTHRGCRGQWKNVRMHSTKFDPVRVNSTSFWLPERGGGVSAQGPGSTNCTSLHHFALLCSDFKRRCQILLFRFSGPLFQLSVFAFSFSPAEQR